jgi:hypothetical protein
LEPDRTTARIGEIVKFKLTTNQPTNNTGAGFILTYGDGNQSVVPLDQAEVTHIFQGTGSFNVVLTYAVYTAIAYVKPTPNMRDSSTIQVDSVSLLAVPQMIETGQTVSFAAQFNPMGQRVRYNFSFGEEGQQSGWTESPETEFTYHMAGTFPAVVEIGTAEGSNTLPPFTRSSVQYITVASSVIDTVFLEADKTSIIRGDRVVFTAYTRREFEGLIHLFRFGDRSKPEKVTEYTVTHEYKDTGTFTASVEAADNRHRLVGTSVTITVSEPPPTLADHPPSDDERPPPPVPPWVYVVGGAIVVLVGYRLVKPLLFPRPEFRPVPDHGAPKIDDRTPLKVTLEIRLKPEIHKGRFSVKTLNGPLVKNVRRRNG